MNKGLILTLVTFLFVGAISALMYISYSNNEIRLAELVSAQVDTRDANYDKAWKVIQQQAQLTDRYANDFKEVYKAMLEGRYGEDGSQAMFQWLQEQNPQLDASMYQTVQFTIEARQEEFFNEQKKLISYNREHVVLRKTFPGSLFVGNRPDVEFNIITSTRTQEVAQSGKEDDVSVF